MLRLTSVLLFCISLLSCTPNYCTKIGCDDGLFITYDLEPESEAVITVVGVGANDNATLVCGGLSDGCSVHESFNEFVVKELHVEISKNGEVLHSYEQVIEYSTVAPNGPKCDPICNQASITVSD